MVLTATLSSLGKVIAVTVAILPIYMIIGSIQETPFLTKESQDLLKHPISMILIAYGTGYAALGDSVATINSLIVLLVCGFYALVLRPDIGSKYIDTKYVKENLTYTKKTKGDASK
jgi:hypothetical protein